jgi:hypothetical protein
MLVAAPLAELVQDMAPLRIVLFNLTDESYTQRFDALQNKWEPVRAGLMLVEVSHPNTRTRELSRELATAIHNSIYITSTLASDLLGRLGSRSRDWHTEANEPTRKAVTKKDEWLEALREEAV